MSSSDMLATMALSSGYLPKKCSRTYAPSRLLNFWYSPSTASSMRLRRMRCLSLARSGSQYEPQMTFSTFQPAPRKLVSSSWMILPLPRTGPSSRCRLQFTTKTRLSSPSRAAMPMAPMRLRLVHLAVAHEGPDLAPGRLREPAVLEVAQEARLVDGLDRAQPHRDRGELPEVGHEPGVRIGGDPLAVDLLAEHVELGLAEAPLEEGARVDPGRGMALHVDEVPAVALRGGVPEVVEAHVVERGRGGEARDVAAQLEVLAAGAQHHGHRVPAHDVAQPVLDLHVARERLLQVRRDRVDVGGAGAVGQVHARAACLVDEALEDEVRAFRAFDGENGFQGVDPFAGFRRVDVLLSVHGGHRVWK